MAATPAVRRLKNEAGLRTYVTLDPIRRPCASDFFWHEQTRMKGGHPENLWVDVKEGAGR